MDRREHLKLLLVSGAGASLFFSTSCTKEEERISEEILRQKVSGYGRTEDEKERDTRLMADKFFSENEFEMVKTLTDIIIPEDDESGSSTDAGVHDFIEFMMKDNPSLQLVTRGGLMWLNNQCTQRFAKTFTECSESERLEIIEEIAWPDDAGPEVQYGVRFFNRMRDLTATGFYTSQMGVEYLDYRGNQPGFWDGVPQEVLEKHELEYDPEFFDKYIKEEERYNIAEWDDEGNLIS